MPPAARGGAFCKNCPRETSGPSRKNFLLKAVMACILKESMQTMTAFGSFKVKMVKKENEGFDTLFI